MFLTSSATSERTASPFSPPSFFATDHSQSCSIRHNYPNLNRWMKNLYWNYPAFKETTNFEHIKVSLLSLSSAIVHLYNEINSLM